MSSGRIPAVEGGIQPTIFDAKADILTATADDTPARLAVGANDTVLTADSSTATGLKWASVSGGGMTLLSTTSLSGATTTISSISQSCNSLFMVVTGVTNATGAGQFRIAPNGTTNISNSLIQGAEGAGSSSGGGLNNTYIRWNYISTIDYTNSNNAMFLWIHNYASSTAYKPFEGTYSFINNASTKSSEFVTGAIFTNTAITSLVFSNSGGNLSTGTVLLYGVK